MRIKLGAPVKSEDNKKIGEIDRVVIDPSDEAITHVVVNKGLLFKEDKLVPISMVAMIDDGEVHLRATDDEINNMGDFEKELYLDYDELAHVDKNQVGYSARMIMYPPSGIPTMAAGPRYIPPVFVRVMKNITLDYAAIVEGADVIGLEGEKVGEVEEVIMDPKLDRATYFVISKGFLFKQRKLVPISWVKTLEDAKVQLIVNETIIEQLPEYPEFES